MTPDKTSGMASVDAAGASQGAGRLAGQVALITGASSGIGRAIALAFLGEGADLVVVARRAERLNELAAEAQRMGRACRMVTGDVRDEDTASRATQAVLDHFGKLDLLVNNAGVGIYKQLEETSPDEYDTMMDSNMRSTFLFTRYAVPVLTRQGSGLIINIS